VCVLCHKLCILPHNATKCVAVLAPAAEPAGAGELQGSPKLTVSPIAGLKGRTDRE